MSEMASKLWMRWVGAGLIAGCLGCLPAPDRAETDVQSASEIKITAGPEAARKTEPVKAPEEEPKQVPKESANAGESASPPAREKESQSGTP